MPTTITGPLLDGSGAPATASISIRAVNVPGASPTTIQYQSPGGDLTGALGGYGASMRGPLRSAALALMPGTYTAFIQCLAGFGSRTYAWTVPSSSTVTIQALIGGTAPPGASNIYATTLANAASPLSLPAATHGMGANPIYVLMAADGVTEILVNCNLDSSGNYTFSWAGTVTGTLSITSGGVHSNYSQALSAVSSQVVTSGDHGLRSALIQCFDASGNQMLTDTALDISTFNFTVSMTPATAGRAIVLGN